MILLKLFHTTEEGVVRLVSVLSPFLFVVVRLIFGAPFGPDTFIFDIAVATAIILLSHRVHPKDKGAVARVRATVSNIVAGSIED